MVLVQLEKSQNEILMFACPAAAQVGTEPGLPYLIKQSRRVEELKRFVVPGAPRRFNARLQSPTVRGDGGANARPG